jgi:hypothetical protein
VPSIIPSYSSFISTASRRVQNFFMLLGIELSPSIVKAEQAKDKDFHAQKAIESLLAFRSNVGFFHFCELLCDLALLYRFAPLDCKIDQLTWGKIYWSSATTFAIS